MNEFKTFKVFYFLGGDHQGIDETRRRWKLIVARNEDEAANLFKIMYHMRLSNNEIFFGWVEEVMPYGFKIKTYTDLE